MQAPGSGVGRWFGPYELLSLLGQGGMGEVYEAYDTVKERMVALKLLSDALADDPEYQIRFRRESQVAARLAEPHIIPIHDWGVIDGRLFIDMRLVQGRDLRAILQAEGALGPQRAVEVIEQIAAALDAAHDGGLVHRDVKPANILVTSADFAYLADFGIARHESDTEMTQAGVAIGSYTYMAPERFDSGPVTPRADIYSLACVLHECLTGATPFPASSMGVLIRSHLAEPPPRASVQRTGLPAALDDVIACGMAKDPHDRFATAGDLAVAARAALNSPARPPHPGSAPGEPAATSGVPSPSAPPTGGIPTLVVRLPRDEDAADPTTMLPAIIPGDPTSVRAHEFEFTPFTPDEPEAPEVPSSGIRPFPDAHLYQNQQLHPDADPAQLPDSGPATGGMPVADFYPHDQATRIYGEAGYPLPGDDETTRVFQPVDETPPAAAYSAEEPTRAYRPAEQYPPNPEDHAEPAGRYHDPSPTPPGVGGRYEYGYHPEDPAPPRRHPAGRPVCRRLRGRIPRQLRREQARARQHTPRRTLQGRADSDRRRGLRRGRDRRRTRYRVPRFRRSGAQQRRRHHSPGRRSGRHTDRIADGHVLPVRDLHDVHHHHLRHDHRRPPRPARRRATLLRVHPGRRPIRFGGNRYRGDELRIRRSRPAGLPRPRGRISGRRAGLRRGRQPRHRAGLHPRMRRRRRGGHLPGRQQCCRLYLLTC